MTGHREDPSPGGPVSAAGPVYWPDLPAEVAEQAWTELRDWVEDLIDRFGLDARTVPPCWYRHPGIVAALAALRDHERACYTPTASPSAGIDWFRAFREIEDRLVGWAARTQCTAREHRDDPAGGWSTDENDWAAFVAADTTTRREAAIHDGLTDH
ncbi:hypothetical protein [Segeticoccus rhizosphaerae]|uniref:hypothetical protein n=1 Tax=Segeticoccus rhizosphaerae TaxID=1104777 RepID=UPI001264DC5C|nr:hypothetical protein [Segeticoccus rhizosphaerae]